MSFSATADIQAAPNDIISAHSAAPATTHDALLSTDDVGDCNMKEVPGGLRALVQAAYNFASRPVRGSLLRCAKVRQTPPCRNFLLPVMLETKLTARCWGVSFYFGSGGFA
jgi:hypothetical protein